MSVTHEQISSQEEIAAECDAIKEILLAKNKAYGDSALAPVRVFSKATPIEQILVRLDDKLSRLAKGSSAGEDVTLDLIGYLVLLRIAEKRRKIVVGIAGCPAEFEMHRCVLSFGHDAKLHSNGCGVYWDAAPIRNNCLA